MAGATLLHLYVILSGKCSEVDRSFLQLQCMDVHSHLCPIDDRTLTLITLCVIYIKNTSDDHRDCPHYTLCVCVCVSLFISWFLSLAYSVWHSFCGWWDLVVPELPDVLMGLFLQGAVYPSMYYKCALCTGIPADGSPRSTQCTCVWNGENMCWLQL